MEKENVGLRKDVEEANAALARQKMEVKKHFWKFFHKSFFFSRWQSCERKWPGSRPEFTASLDPNEQKTTPSKPLDIFIVNIQILLSGFTAI